MDNQTVHVVATTISGSIHDWSKLDKIIPAFRAYGMDEVVLHRADSHAEARAHACNEFSVGCG